MNESEKKAFFEQTLVLAGKGWGNTHPNPMVGALIVEGGQIVAEGYHQKAGSPHAEVEAIRALDRVPQDGASMFVSLEPCSTTGRTPPCVQGILNAGIKRVYIGAMDPNPAHAGRGIDILRDAGVRVEMANEEFQTRATRLNLIFNHNITSGNALVALKLAESANGMLAEVKGQPSRITEDEARADMMTWRRLFPAICVGSGTVLADNPNLTARLPEETFCPVRLVLDASLSTLEESVFPRNLYTDEYSSQTKVLTTALGIKNESAVKKADELGIALIVVGHDDHGRIELADLSGVLKQFNLNAVYCEGGASVAQSLLGEDLVDFLFRYQSPKLFSGPDALPGPDLDALTLREPITAKLGEDRLTHGFL